MNANNIIKRYLFFIVALSGIMVTRAQDRLFTYTYQSTVLNKGQRELESWNTIRTGRDDFYVRFDNRTEFEIGLGGKLQTAFYLNLSSKTKTAMEDTVKVLSTENEIGFSNEWKLKILDPVADPVGLALYAEAGISSNEFDLEGKIILDKRIGHFTIAGNGVYEFEFAPHYQNNELAWKTEQKLDGVLGFAWSFGTKFHLTQENTCNNVFSDGKLAHSTLYSGLGMSYSLEKFWVNFTILPQVASFKGSTNSKLNLNEFEKIQFRLLFSYMF
jgi:hypothetical protein